jgi:hypothetical protein
MDTFLEDPRSHHPNYPFRDAAASAKAASPVWLTLIRVSAPPPAHACAFRHRLICLRRSVSQATSTPRPPPLWTISTASSRTRCCSLLPKPSTPAAPSRAATPCTSCSRDTAAAAAGAPRERSAPLRRRRQRSRRRAGFRLCWAGPFRQSLRLRPRPPPPLLHLQLPPSPCDPPRQPRAPRSAPIRAPPRHRHRLRPPRKPRCRAAAQRPFCSDAASAFRVQVVVSGPRCCVCSDDKHKPLRCLPCKHTLCSKCGEEKFSASVLLYPPTLLRSSRDLTDEVQYAAASASGVTTLLSGSHFARAC